MGQGLGGGTAGRSAGGKSSQAGESPAWPATQVGLGTAAGLYLQGGYGVDSVAMLPPRSMGKAALVPVPEDDCLPTYFIENIQRINTEHEPERTGGRTQGCFKPGDCFILRGLSAA